MVVFGSCGVTWFLVVGGASNFAGGDDDFSGNGSFDTKRTLPFQISADEDKVFLFLLGNENHTISLKFI